MADIYNIDRSFERIRKKIREDTTISNHNREIIEKFTRNCISNENVGKSRMQRYLYDLIKIGRFLGSKKFEETTRKDIEDILDKFISLRSYSPRTILDFKKTLKKFYKWLRGTENAPPEVSWLKSNNCDDKERGNKILTEEEIGKLIEIGVTPFEKCFVSMLYETGCRIGEIANIKIGDLEFLDGKVIIGVNGKTGYRKIMIKNSIPFLEEYLNHHPDRKNKSAPLWYGSKKYIGSYRYFSQVLEELGRKAGIKKPVNPHNFRHSRATVLAGILPESVLCEYMGWAQGSKMASVYVHLSGKRTLEIVGEKVYGEKTEKEIIKDIDKKLKPIICPHCKKKNPPTNAFCSCGQILDFSLLSKEDKEIEKLKSVYVELLRKDDVQEFLVEALKKIIKENPDILKGLEL